MTNATTGVHPSQLHPAVAPVRDLELGWAENYDQARVRAVLVVNQLIHAGFLKGEIKGGIPCVLVGDDAYDQIPKATINEFGVPYSQKPKHD